MADATKDEGFHPQIGESWSKEYGLPVLKTILLNVSIPRLGRVDRKLRRLVSEKCGTFLDVSIPRLGRVDRKDLKLLEKVEVVA